MGVVREQVVEVEGEGERGVEGEEVGMESGSSCVVASGNCVSGLLLLLLLVLASACTAGMRE